MTRDRPTPAPGSVDLSVRRMEQLIARLLQAGVLASGVLLVAGAALGAAAPAAGTRLLTAGLLVLIATPVLRVAVSVAVFARQGDRTFVLVTGGVLALLVLSFLLGKAG